MNYLALNLKKIRSVNKLSQTKFAEHLHVTRAAISSYEEGRANPKQDLLIKIAKTYRLDIDSLLNRALTVNDIIGLNEKQLNPTTLHTQNKVVPLITIHQRESYLNNPLLQSSKHFSFPFDVDCEIAFEYKSNWFLLCAKQSNSQSYPMYLSTEGISFEKTTRTSQEWHVVGEIRLNQPSPSSQLEQAIDRLHREIDRL